MAFNDHDDLAIEHDVHGGFGGPNRQIEPPALYLLCSEDDSRWAMKTL